MNKTLITCVTVALLLLTSARYITPSDGRVGYQAPSLSLSNNTTTVQLQDLRGKYVVVTFWSSAQPETRLSNKLLSQATTDNGNVVHLAVNMDRSEGLFEQLRLIDGLPDNTQFHIDGDAQQHIMQSWRQSPEAFSSFLIDTKGKIVKKNPTVDDLALL